MKMYKRLNNVNKQAPSYKRVKWGTIIGLFLTLTMLFVILILPWIIYWLIPILVFTPVPPIMYFTEDGLLTWAVQQVNVRDLPMEIPFYVKLYLWAVDNPDEFQEGAPPKLTEVGPFAFGLKSGQIEIGEFDNDGETMEIFIKDIGLHLAESRSAMDDYDTNITIINPLTWLPVMFIQSVGQHIPFSWLATPIQFAGLKLLGTLLGEGVFRVVTPRQLVEGIYISLLDAMDLFVITPVKWLIDTFQVTLPQPLPLLLDLWSQFAMDNKVGVLHSVNGARIGPIEIRTGKGGYGTMFWPVSVYGFDITLGPYLLSYLFETISLVEDQRCKMRNGSFIPFYPFLSKQDTIYLPIPCRPPAFTYKETVYYMGVAPDWRFWLDDYMAGPRRNPSNRCFCPYPDDPDMCDGIVDIGLCALYAPIALSLPHLMNAGPKIRSLVEGMTPDEDKHLTYVDLNPIGFPVMGRVRLQINLITRPAPLSWGWSDVPQTVLPFAWFETPDLPEWIWLMHSWGMVGLAMVEYGRFLLLSIGLIILVMSWRRAYKDRDILFPEISHDLQIRQTADRPKVSGPQRIYPKLYDRKLISDEDVIEQMPNGFGAQHKKYSFGTAVKTLPKGSGSLFERRPKNSLSTIDN